MRQFSVTNLLETLIIDEAKDNLFLKQQVMMIIATAIRKQTTAKMILAVSLLVV